VPATLAVRLRAKSENALRMMATQCWMATQCRPGDTLSLPRVRVPAGPSRRRPVTGLRCGATVDAAGKVE
jgi:hypothetical protein